MGFYNIVIYCSKHIIYFTFNNCFPTGHQATTFDIKNVLANNSFSLFLTQSYCMASEIDLYDAVLECGNEKLHSSYNISNILQNISFCVQQQHEGD